MSTAEHLGSQWTGSLFHGTAHDLVGDTLKPGVRLGAGMGTDYHKHLGQSRDAVVSASSQEEKAWNVAQISGPGRPRVHIVESHPETRMGVENLDHPEMVRAFEEKRWHKPVDNAEYVAPSFKVKDTEWTIPPTHGETHRQGTLPQIDWAEHVNKDQFGQVGSHEKWKANFGQPLDTSEAERDAHREHRRRLKSGDHWKRSELHGQQAMF